ncbi:hypothetical protein MsAg5_15870 [Methanosarcinaceae archaeon Ag5]|uniref:Uncharacterized protein n=1 Tax=Methanolapillus africanus TaxID=3028297 RepID=A0AAE4MKL2_9EURY|nr:hypothetical protein [Methanosarcinaceae archaeon Ag5]
MEITPKTMGQIVVLVLIILFALLAADAIYGYFVDEQAGSTCVVPASAGNTSTMSFVNFKETGIPINFNVSWLELINI